MSEPKINRLMEKDEKGVDRQYYPVTHISAIEGLDLTPEMVEKLKLMINSFDPKSAKIEQ